MVHFIDPMVRPIARWAEQSQRQACRNAMVASTALTARRQERDEAEEFVRSALARRRPTASEPHAREVGRAVI